ncbi:MAG TPA: GDSL-type esterase/lipase family protein [Chryseosolibacter sp.]
MIKLALIAVLTNVYLVSSFAQSHEVPYKEDVQVIKKYDNMYPQPENPILFVGSSSIRLWKDFNQKFGKYGAINRGIGGAVVNDILYHTEDLIVRYNPRKIVLYVGENDLPNASSTADSVLNRTVRLYNRIRSRLPDVPIIYIAMKPSPSRDQFQVKAMEGNRLIKNFFEGKKDVTFLDIYTPMLAGGKSRPELFLEDRLHMNEKGYAIWEKKLKKHLK